MAPSSVPRLLLALVLTAAAISSAAAKCSQCTAQCSAIKDGRGPCPYPPADPSYSYFLFVLQWPGTYCRNDPQCCDGKFPQGVDWTIHGLWPEKSQDCYPYCCDLSSVKFSHRAIASLSDLKTYWPTLSCKNTDDSFHANEWDKHGTCALDALQALSSDPVHYYFQRTLELRKALPLARILSNQGIVPADDQTYTPDEIISAIRDFTKATPDLDCKGGLIDEVHFCVDTDLQTYIDCPTGAELAAKDTFDMVTRGHGGGSGGRDRKKKRASCPDAIRIPTFDAVVV